MAPQAVRRIEERAVFQGFKKFIMRGNVFDLAVAVVMGTAFTAVVTAVVTNLINPLIAAIGGSNINGLSVQLIAGNNKARIDFGAVITAVINFVIIAAVVYFAFVLPMAKLIERRNRGKEPKAEPITELDVLTEIRDLLRDQQQRPNSGSRGGQY
jgi:large conductance mechanosensitive channel